MESGRPTAAAGEVATGEVAAGEVAAGEVAAAAGSADPEVGLRAVAALRVLTERLEMLQVDNARRLGWSWQDIAGRLGVTKQTVHPQTWKAGRARRKRGRKMTRRLSWPARLGRTAHRASATRPRGGRAVQRMTPGARSVFRGGFEHAVRLGHRHLGSEHLLLALVERDHPAAAVLRAHGLRADRVEEQLVRLGAGGIFGGLDESSLSAIGIDLEAVRERALASFGPEALARAGSAVEADAAARRAGSARWLPGVARTQPGAWHGGVSHVRRIGRRPVPAALPDVGELFRGAQEAGLLEPAAPLDVPQLAVGLLSVTGGAVPPVLAALGVRPSALRAAVAETGEPGGA